MKKAKAKKVKRNVGGSKISVIVTPNRRGGTLLMPTMWHGSESRKTQRRKAKQYARSNGWD